MFPIRDFNRTRSFPLINYALIGANLFIWFGIQVLSGLVSSPGQGGVAWWAHIGGFIAGITIVKFLFARPYPTRRFPWGRVRDVPFTRS